MHDAEIACSWSGVALIVLRYGAPPTLAAFSERSQLDPLMLSTSQYNMSLVLQYSLVLGLNLPANNAKSSISIGTSSRFLTTQGKSTQACPKPWYDKATSCSHEVGIVEQHYAALDVRLAEIPNEVVHGGREVRLSRVL